MNGLAYYFPKGSIIMDGTWEKDSKRLQYQSDDID